MRYFQFVRHQLIGMFTMRFSQVFMQQDTMADRQDRIHPIQSKKHDISEVSGLQDQFPKREHDDKGYAQRPHITGKTLRPFTEVEEAKDQ